MRSVMMELLRHPTPQLPCTLEGPELCTRLGDDGAAAAPHTGVDVCTREAVCALGHEEQLRHTTPELMHALGGAVYALGDDGAAAAPHTGADACARGADFALGAGAATAPHTGAVVHSQRCDCYVHLESFGNTGATVASPYRSSHACLMMEMLFTLNADNGQIFSWIGLDIGLVSRGSFR